MTPCEVDYALQTLMSKIKARELESQRAMNEHVLTNRLLKRQLQELQNRLESKESQLADANETIRALRSVTQIIAGLQDEIRALRTQLLTPQVHNHRSITTQIRNPAAISGPIRIQAPDDLSRRTLSQPTEAGPTCSDYISQNSSKECTLLKIISECGRTTEVAVPRVKEEEQEVEMEGGDEDGESEGGVAEETVKLENDGEWDGCFEYNHAASQTFRSRQGLIKANEFNEACLMCKTGVQPSEEHLDRRHFRYAVHFKEHGVDLFTVPCYCDRLPDMKRSHWHCFKCGAILSRRHVLKRHLEIHGCTSLKDYSTDCPAAPSGQAGPCPVDPETSVLTSGQETDADDTENISQSPHASSLEGPPTESHALTSISDLASGVEDGGGVESGDGGVVRPRLKHHSLKHQGRIPSIRRCLCPLCGRSFPRLDLRRNHMRVCPARFPPAATQGSARRQLQPLRAPPDTPS